jgi:AcrR family transcriptional regulator
MNQDKIDLKRSTILRAALKIIGERGYHYATLSQIATEAGVSRGLIHFYFENKLDLLISLMLFFIEKVNSTHQQELTTLDAPLEKLRCYFKVFNNIVLNDEDSLYWGNILREGLPPAQMLKSKMLREKYGRIVEGNKNLMKTIVEIIGQAQTIGTLDNSIPPQILALILGGSLQFLYYGLFLQRTRSVIVNNNYETMNELLIKNAMEILINKFSLYPKHLK